MDLADRAIRQHPMLSALLMSGQEIEAAHLAGPWHDVRQKPFVLEDLSRKLAALLERA